MSAHGQSEKNLESKHQDPDSPTFDLGRSEKREAENFQKSGSQAGLNDTGEFNGMVESQSSRSLSRRSTVIVGKIAAGQNDDEEPEELLSEDGSLEGETQEVINNRDVNDDELFVAQVPGTTGDGLEQTVRVRKDLNIDVEDEDQKDQLALTMSNVQPSAPTAAGQPTTPILGQIPILEQHNEEDKDTKQVIQQVYKFMMEDFTEETKRNILNSGSVLIPVMINEEGQVEQIKDNQDEQQL